MEAERSLVLVEELERIINELASRLSRGIPLSLDMTKAVVYDNLTKTLYLIWKESLTVQPSF